MFSNNYSFFKPSNMNTISPVFTSSAGGGGGGGAPTIISIPHQLKRISSVSDFTSYFSRAPATVMPEVMPELMPELMPDPSQPKNNTFYGGADNTFTVAKAFSLQSSSAPTPEPEPTPVSPRSPFFPPVPIAPSPIHLTIGSRPATPQPNTFFVPAPVKSEGFAAASPPSVVTASSLAPKDYTEIVPNLYVGNVRAAQQFHSAFDLIVNCTTHIPFYGPRDPARQIHLPVLDTPSESEKLYSLLRKSDALQRINAAIREGKRVLIHCHMGAQRSATVAAAYLLAYYRLTIDDAITAVRAARPIALIWVNFRRTLELVWVNLRR